MFVSIPTNSQFVNNSLSHSLSHSNDSFTHSLTHSVTNDSFTHSLTHLLTPHSLTHTCTYDLPPPSLPPSSTQNSSRESHQHTFSVFRPKLSLSELHPNEGDVRSVLTEDMWQSLFGPDGRITESRCVKKVWMHVSVSQPLCA